jgi:hypothetical protein
VLSESPMSQSQLKAAFKSCSGPFPWRKFAQLLRGLGYEQLPTGKTSGSRRKYFNQATKDMIFLDEPHDGEMGPSMVRRLRKELEEKGVI